MDMHTAYRAVLACQNDASAIDRLNADTMRLAPSEIYRAW
jgi:hypothetical protein